MKAASSATLSILSGSTVRLSLLCNAAAGSLLRQSLPAAAASTASRGAAQSILKLQQQHRLFSSSGSAAGSEGPGELCLWRMHVVECMHCSAAAERRLVSLLSSAQTMTVVTALLSSHFPVEHTVHFLVRLSHKCVGFNCALSSRRLVRTAAAFSPYHARTHLSVQNMGSTSSNTQDF